MWLPVQISGSGIGCRPGRAEWVDFPVDIDVGVLVPDEEIAALMRQQFGLLTRAQARAAGVSARSFDHRVATGVWRRVGRGVVQSATHPVTWRSRLLAACLETGGVASHRSAAVLHAVDDFRPGQIEITIPYGRRTRIRGVTVHRTTQWWPDQHIRLDGIPCTSIERTVVDIAAVVGRTRLDDALDAVMRTNRWDLPDLVDIVVAHARRGRDGCGRLREAVDRRRPKDRVPRSVWSRKVGALLRSGGLAAPRYEHPIELDGTVVAHVDLAYPNARLAIELDSVSWHLDRFQFDRERWNAVTEAGWRLLVFTWLDFVSHPDDLVRTVRRVSTTEI